MLNEKNYDHLINEEEMNKLWVEKEIYKFDPTSNNEVFSVDTPPPYASASHMHVGHAMSYSQAEFIVRYQRMMGKSVYYPVGFDDNGLPTERHVEKVHNINKNKTTRPDFRKLCLEETQNVIGTYRNLFSSLGLSVDWNLQYSTIDEHCQKTAQKSFLDLYNKNMIYRSDDPVLWDTHFQTALAQADLETLSRKGKMYDIPFKGEDGSDLIISTTRPEFLPACVGLYCNPDDERYTSLVGKTAIVPIFGHEVPIKTSDEVAMDFGTGLMMVCTFGDNEDVMKWKLDNLDLRIAITPNGRMSDICGDYAGLPIVEARSKIVKDLKAEGLILDEKVIDQNISIAERSQTPVEFIMEPQWFIKTLDLKDDLLKRGDEINWYPTFMKSRYVDWVNNLKFDWNISRQRFYGVPFPVWYCEDCGEIIIAPEENMPVDPTNDKCHLDECPKCKSKNLKGETDVMDTWMTSSLTPLVANNWAGSSAWEGKNTTHPMTVRVQAHDIIRTWLFYTVLKSHIHKDSLPWKDVMISGFGENEQGKKISKRTLEKATDNNGYNRYVPENVMEKYGADALRYWAAGSHLGQNMKYNEKDVKAGRKVVVKLFNASKFVLMQLEGMDVNKINMPVAERTVEDRWVISELNKVAKRANECLAKYDYAGAKDAIDKFFWMTFCDTYLELVKDRFWSKEKYSDELRESAAITLWETLRDVIGMFAPFIPFVTEMLYQEIFREGEGKDSIHITSYPQYCEYKETDVSEMAVVLGVLKAVRACRTENQIGQGKHLAYLRLDVENVNDKIVEILKKYKLSLMAVSRAQAIEFGKADFETSEVEGLKISIQIKE